MSLLILYGTETGTAQDIAESIRRDALLRNIHSRVVAFDDYPVESLSSEATVVFVVSTTGQGEIPPMMQPAWRWLLRKAIPTDWLQSVKCAVFGLGDSSYAKYNQAGIKLYRRLLQIGAEMMAPRGLGDDQHELGLDGAYIPWKIMLWTYMEDHNLFPDAIYVVDPSQLLPSKYELDYDCGTVPEAKEQDFFELRVAANERVTADKHFQDTRLVDFEIPDWQKWRYNPGDVLMVRPYNLAESVQVAIEALGYPDEVLDRPFSIRPRDSFTKTPPQWLLGGTTTLRTCFERYFDLQTIPKKSFFEVLSTLATDPMEKEKLQELSSPNFIDDLMDYSYRARRTTAEALRDFPHTAKSIEPEYLFDLFRAIRPRAFSIASAGDKQKDRIQLLVAKVEYRSRMSEPRRGLCSSFIARLLPGDHVFARLRAGTFRFPPVSQSVVCIGPGTGVAPFRSFLKWRDGEQSPASAAMFFGCRGKERDFYFEAEWSTLSSVSLITAFSRDSDRKVYVQDRMKETVQLLWETLGIGRGYCFVAGSAGDMPKAVIAALDEVAAECGWADGSFSDVLERQGRLQFETWS